MTEPAEVLVIKDQYKMACHCLSRGLAIEEAGNTEDALDYYRMGRQHLAQGLEVPTGGDRHEGQVWDAARQLQLKMREALRTVNAHLTDLATTQPPVRSQSLQTLNDLPTTFNSEQVPNGQPPLNQFMCPALPPRAKKRIPTPLALPTPLKPQSALPTPLTPQSALPAPLTPQTTVLTPLSPPSSVPTTPSPQKKVPPPIPPKSKVPTPLSPPPRPSSCPPYVSAVPALPPRTIAMDNPADHPPAYTPQPTNGHCTLGFGPTGFWSGNQCRVGQNESELLFIPSGVQMFFVAPDGEVSSLSNPGYLRIILTDSEKKQLSTDKPSAFLHVCDRLYPLTSDTPVLLASSGIFMFSDSSAKAPGSFVGIVLSSQLPPTFRNLFQDLLLQLTDFRIQSDGADSDVINLSKKVPLGSAQPGEKPKILLPAWSEKMSSGILSGANWLGQGLIKTAEATGRAVHRGGHKIRDHTTPQETASDVNPSVTKGLHVTEQASGGVLKVSRFLVDGVSKVIGVAVEKAAPHVKKHGAKLVPESLKNQKEGEPSNWEGVKLVASSSFQGFSTVWSSLEDGAKLVGKSVRAETVTSVTYKYGDPTGQATDTAIQSVVNVGVSAYNFDNLGVKAIMKTTGKSAAKAMVDKEDKETPDKEKPDAEKTEEQKKEEKSNPKT